MIASKNFPAPGTEVGCHYRWPYDHAHPDCWIEPHKGIVLAIDDPRAWRNTLAFPEASYPNGPPQELVTTHVERCLKDGLLDDKVPVLWTWTHDQSQAVQWDSELRPYADELTAWQQMREHKRKEYCSHNTMVANDDPNHVWKCADCGYVYN